ncbi:MAG: hypothetical protein WBP54_05800, partial [Pelodictyon phaeoclathratiforme]
MTGSRFLLRASLLLRFFSIASWCRLSVSGGFLRLPGLLQLGMIFALIKLVTHCFSLSDVLNTSKRW